jgi:hypothetical protein
MLKFANVTHGKEVLMTMLLNHPFGDCFEIIVEDDPIAITNDEGELDAVDTIFVGVKFVRSPMTKRQRNVARAYCHAICNIEKRLAGRVW